jgi:hypothetical protein
MLGIESFFGLRIEGWVLNLSIDKYPQILLDVMWPDLKFLILLFEGNFDLLNNLICDVIDMSSTFGSTDTIDKRYLLELTVTETCNNLPTIMFLFNNLWEIFCFNCIKIEFTILIKVLD